MARDTKLALIIGFALLLVVGLVISDQYSARGTGSGGEPAQGLAFAEPLSRSAEADGDGLVQLGPRAESAVPLEVVAGGNASPSALVMGEPGGNRVGSQASRDDDAESWRAVLKQFSGTGVPAASQTDVVTRGQPSQSTTEGAIAIPRRVDVEKAVADSTPEPERASAMDGVIGRTAEVREHVVASGETLWSIAEKYYGDGRLHGILWSANPDVVGEGGAVRRGARLVIPGSVDEGRSGGRPSVAERDRGTTPAPPARMYVVRKGDVLGTIALNELGTSRRWEEIFELNRDKLDRPEDLREGMELRLPR